MNQVLSYSLTTLAELIRIRAVSPIELINSYLEHIADLNPRLNAIVTIAGDVREQAARAEAAILRGDQLGALHGLPLTVKDTIETAGLRSTSGSVIRAGFTPDRDAPAVTLLKSAGAIVLGKTNAAEMAMDYDADNPVFGRTNNPYDSELTPGGSSGGEAAAIASFMSPAGLGSDLAGSIRIPAHFCGITGLKPTSTSVPGEGQFPPATGPYSLGAAIGPLARTVSDVRIVFDVLAGRRSDTPELKSAHVAWYVDDDTCPVTTETANAVVAAATALKDAGVIVNEMRPPHIERAHELWLKIFSRASVVQLRNVYAGRLTEGGSFVKWRLETADDTKPPTLDEYILSWMLRDQLRTELLEWMQTTPLLLCPVGATPAYKHGTLKVSVAGGTVGTFKAFSYAQAFNVFDLPAITIPVGRSPDGLPIGVQIAGLPFREDMVLAAAEIVERAVGGNRTE